MLPEMHYAICLFYNSPLLLPVGWRFDVSGKLSIGKGGIHLYFSPWHPRKHIALSRPQYYTRFNRRIVILTCFALLAAACVFPVQPSYHLARTIPISGDGSW